MGLPTNVCLQCEESREAVKAEKLFCGLVGGYEYREVYAEWDKHHWRDWTDAELKDAGLTPSRWNANRRTSVTDLEWPARESWCEVEGHFPINLEHSGPDRCPWCYTDLTALAASGQEVRFREVPNND